MSNNPTIRVVPIDPDAGSLLRAGQRFGHYEIVAALGKGGMGSVYEAIDLENGRRIALKLLAHSLDSPEARKRFLREGRLAAAINHPNTVYVFGTEEIEGTPVIAMELVSGGSLERRIRETGPMPIAAAVEAILQIVAGLEAACAAGILHRDIKPANCFLEPDGTIKVGDFGLSISTGARAETRMTVAGSFIGTPAFSSPEQLRGDELTVGSDIYAVGATLFYLLTGRTPFEADNMVQLLATVLERPAISPAKWRPDIPRGLCRVILRSLEKKREARFKDYGQFREALLPYTSAAPTPATLGLRFLAGCIDSLMLSLIFGIPSSIFLLGSRAATSVPGLFKTPSSLFFLASNFLLMPLYYTILEGVWGTSAGKLICRLRVVDRQRNPPGIARAFVRTLIVEMLPSIPTLLTTKFWFSAGSLESGGWKNVLVANCYYLILASIFLSARRRNGYAALHDLLTGTRVVLTSDSPQRDRLDVNDELVQPSDGAARLGPYEIVRPLSRGDSGELLLGFDPRLLRKIWIRKVPEGTPPVASEVRNAACLGRSRWLAGSRSDQDSWDAYEALPGAPLLELIPQPQPWERVRFWLLDLAEAVVAERKQGISARVLELDRVWITNDGAARLLDFPAPGIERSASAMANASAPPPMAALSDEAPAFLNRLALDALHGLARPLPLHARAFLEDLQKGLALTDLIERLKPLLRRNPSVSRAKRLVIIGLCSVFPLMALLFMLSFPLAIKRAVIQNPELVKLRDRLRQFSALRARSNADGLDGVGAAYSANILGTSLTWDGTSFELGSTNGAGDFICSTGQVIRLPEGNFSRLRMLGTAVQGCQLLQKLTITYADGSTSNTVQGFSDWYAPGNFPGEAIAAKFPYRNLSLGQRDERAFYLYAYSLQLAPDKKAAAFTLPNNPKVRVLAITLTPPATSIDLAGIFNGTNGIVTDGSVFSDGDPIRKALEICIVADFRQYFGSSNNLGYAGTLLIPPDARATAEKLVALHPNVTAEELREATNTLDSFFAAQNVKAEADTKEADQGLYHFGPGGGSNAANLSFLTFTSLITVAAYVAIPSVLCALCFRRGLILFLLGLVLVNKEGKRASRLRVFCRSLVAWAPALVLALFVFAPLWHKHSAPYQTLGYVLILIWMGLAIGPAILATRSIQDRLCGTWLVPK